MKYVRVCDEYGDEYITTYQDHCEHVANLQDNGFDFEGCIVKQSDTIRGLIMKGDLVFAKDGYAGINATVRPSIASDDIDKCTQYFEKHITKFYIELSNGDYRLAAKEERGELELL